MIIEDVNLRNLFFTSAENYLRILTEGLLGLEKNPQDNNIINETFRAAHSFKSESLTMEFGKIGALCHALEDIFGYLKSTPGSSIDSDSITTLLGIVDELRNGIRSVKDGGAEPDTEKSITNLQVLVESLQGNKTDEHTTANGTVGEQVKAETKSTPSSATAAPETESPKIQPEPISEQTSKVKVVDTINVKTQILDNLMNLMEEFVILKLRLENALEAENIEKIKEFKKNLDLLLNELQFYIAQARLIPIGQIFENFPRLVRDMAKTQNKNIDFEMKGLDLRIDRTIADRLLEPLVHILRNSVDHGIESSEERKKQNKPSLARILISARREKDRAVLEISDDGQGFNFETIKQAIKIKHKITDQELESYNQAKILSLLYQGGVSTNEQVTSYSGRGMGLYAVKMAMDYLGGDFRIDTEIHKGTLFTLEFPLSLAIIKALLVEIGHEKFAIPTINVIQSLRLTADSIERTADLNSYILNNEEVPLLDLGERFYGRPTKITNIPLPVIIVGQSHKKIGFLVSRILGMEDITVKSLSEYSLVGKDFSGATVLGDGKVALIIDVPAIFNEL